MAAVVTGHHLDDGAGFAMPPCSENDAVVSPFHRQSAYGLSRQHIIPVLSFGKLQAHFFAIAFRVVAPAFADLHEQE